MDPPGNDLAGLISDLSEARFQDYLYLPMPNDLDNEVLALVHAYEKLDRGERSTLQTLLVRESVDILESFAERQAVFAVRSGSTDPLRFALMALGMTFPRGDTAQVVMALAKLDHSARLLGADLADIALDALAFLPEQFRYFTARFLAHDDRDGLLLTKLGFAAYGSGPDFVYDNAIPGAAPTPPRPPSHHRSVVRRPARSSPGSVTPARSPEIRPQSVSRTAPWWSPTGRPDDGCFHSQVLTLPPPSCGPSKARTGGGS